MFTFKYPPYTCVLKMHDNGVIAVLSHENLNEKIKLGLVPNNNVYLLEDFNWIDANTIYEGETYSGSGGLINYIFDNYLGIIKLTENARKFMNNLLKDMVENKSLDWIPEAKYYTFEGEELLIH
uniref:Uncharacterized protein n=1 Tax=Pithovirus LCPAC302 TaxID=2506593 RepID=A0A481Z6S2_9VIRU|nr:MAG: hypothetical protein LCPAC302_00870 [Pithovirus LCPAC302]